MFRHTRITYASKLNKLKVNFETCLEYLKYSLSFTKYRIQTHSNILTTSHWTITLMGRCSNFTVSLDISNVRSMTATFTCGTHLVVYLDRPLGISIGFKLFKQVIMSKLMSMF